MAKVRVLAEQECDTCDICDIWVSSASVVQRLCM